MFLSPQNRVFATLASIAGTAEQLQVRGIARSTSDDRENVINLKRALLPTRGASTSLLPVKNFDIGNSKIASILGLSRTPDSGVNPISLPIDLWVSRGPSRFGLIGFGSVFLRPALHFRSVAVRILGPTLSRPFSLKSGASFVPALATNGGAFDALGSRGSARTLMAITAWLRRHVGLFSGQDGGTSFRAAGRHVGSNDVNYSNVALAT